MFHCVCMLICAIISGISSFPSLIQLGQIIIKQMPFPQGCHWTNFWTDRAIFLLFIYSFSLRRSRPFKNTAWFSSSALNVCTRQRYSAHASGVFVSETVSSRSSGRFALPCLLWCHYICFCAWDRCQKACVGRRWFHEDYAEYNAKQVTKSLQDAGLHLYFCKHSSIKYKWVFQGCVFSSGMPVYFIIVIRKLIPLGSGKQERQYLFLSSPLTPPSTLSSSCFLQGVVTVQWLFLSESALIYATRVKS